MGRSQLPEAVGSSSPTHTLTGSTEKPRSRFSWVQSPIDSLVGLSMLTTAEAGNTKRLVSALRYVQNITFTDDEKSTAMHKAAAGGHTDVVKLLEIEAVETVSLGNIRLAII